MVTAYAELLMTPVEVAIALAALAHYEEKFSERLADQHREAIQSLRAKLVIA